MPASWKCICWYMLGVMLVTACMFAGLAALDVRVADLGVARTVIGLLAIYAANFAAAWAVNRGDSVS